MRKNIGFLGAGAIAQKVAPMLKLAGFTPYAVASCTNAKEFAMKHGFERFYSNYQDLVNDGEVDLIYINTPHSLHFSHAKLCLEHQKNVLCEKSFTLNATQAQQLIALAQQKQLFLAEAIWTRYMPYVAIIQNLLQQKIIGDIVSIEANLAYSIADKPRIQSLELGGGALLDVGVYTLNFACLFLTSEIINIEAVCKKMPSGVDESNGIILEFKNGQMAFLNSSVNAINTRQGTINGTHGYISVNNINNPSFIEVFDNNRLLTQKIAVPQQINGYEYEFEACFQAIQHNQIESVAMPHSETIKIMSLMDSIRTKLGIQFIGE